MTSSLTSSSTTDLYPFRLVHFLALTLLVVRFVPREWAAWDMPA
jgi:OpgC protein